MDSDEPPPAKELPSLTVRGRVVDEAGRPIAQAEVFVSDGWLEERDMLAVSDDDGRFEGQTRLRSWGVMFSVFALGFAGTWREVDIHGGHELELGTFRLRPGAAIAGVVVDETGTPLAGAAVTRYPAEAFPTDIAAARRQGPDDSTGYELGYFFANAAADGRFSMSLPLGECFLSAWSKGRSYGWTEIFVVRASGNAEQRIVLPLSDLAGGHIGGIVRDPRNTPVEGVEIQMRRKQYRMTLASTDATGRFLLTDDWKERVDLFAVDPEQRWADAEALAVAPGTRDLELVLGEPVWLEVRLEDADAHPVPWGHVRVGHRLFDTGREGLVRLQKPAESFKLEGSAPGFRTETFGPFDPAAVEDSLVLRLSAGQAVRGRIVHRGRPVAGARIGLDSTRAPGTTFESTGCAPLDQPFLLTGKSDIERDDGTSDARGEFVLTLHADGWHSLRVSADGFPVNVFGPWEFSREAGFSGLELELEQGGALEGRLRLAPGTTAGERLVAACNGWSFARTALVQEDGTYRIEDLAPGSYQVRLCQPPVADPHVLFVASATSEAPVWDCRVVAAETTRFDLDLANEDSVVLTGQLTLDGARPLEWEARLASAQVEPGRIRSPRAFAKVDAEGRFDLRLSQSGVYRLELRAGTLFIMDELELFDGQNKWAYRRETSRVQITVAPLKLTEQAASWRYSAIETGSSRFFSQWVTFREKAAWWTSTLQSAPADWRKRAVSQRGRRNGRSCASWSSSAAKSSRSRCPEVAWKESLAGDWR